MTEGLTNADGTPADTLKGTVCPLRGGMFPTGRAVATIDQECRPDSNTAPGQCAVTILALGSR